MADKGTLNLGEPHPAYPSARAYLAGLAGELLQYSEALASCAIEGNRLAEICHETLSRLIEGKPVSDRYLLGLAWAIKDIRKEI